MADSLPIIDIVRVELGSSPCPYLPHVDSNLEYRVIDDVSRHTNGRLIRRGWRRHGRYFFRPQCGLCQECRSLRVVVDKFRPTRSQRRCLKRNSDVRVVCQRPSVTERHVELFNAYHQDMHERRGWPDRLESAADYYEAFLIGEPEFGREFLYFKQGELIGISLVDLAPQGLSSVYFFHDPGWRPTGPGTYSLLQEIYHAQAAGLPYCYLGYWIAGCQSMNYKSRFGPHQLLAAYVDDDREPVWNDVTPAGSQ